MARAHEQGEVKANTLGETHDMAADGGFLSRAGRAETRDSFTGERRVLSVVSCSYIAASGAHSKGTKARVKAVDHHDIEVGRSPVGASADQVQGIQRGSGSQQASEWEHCSSTSVEDDGDAVRLSGQVPAGVAARAGEAGYRYLGGGEGQRGGQVEVPGVADEKRGRQALGPAFDE